ncbi:MAG: hypothetical protein KatS3mg010_1214 [Acidimicrobiia bacterium]|nr:MAG: hypothetical protein KatS3mg010_1214 [Acidimicrobiia bacterium]
MIGQAAREPVGLAGVVEHGAAADAHEVAFVARLDHPLLELGELRVAQLEVDPAAVDPAVLVAPLGERLGRVEHLLVEAEASRIAGVGERRDLDRLGGDTGIGPVGERLALGRLPADDAEVAERAVVEPQFAVAARVAGRLAGGPGVARLGGLLVAPARGEHEGQHRQDRDEAQSPHVSTPRSRTHLTPRQMWVV